MSHRNYVIVDVSKTIAGYAGEENGTFVLDCSDVKELIPIGVFKQCNRELLKLPLGEIPDSCTIVKQDSVNDLVINEAKERALNRLLSNAEQQLSDAQKIHSTMVTSYSAANELDNHQIEIMEAELRVLRAQKNLKDLKNGDSAEILDSSEVIQVKNAWNFGYVDLFDYISCKGQFYGIGDESWESYERMKADFPMEGKSFYDSFQVDGKTYHVVEDGERTEFVDLLEQYSIFGAFADNSPSGVGEGHKYYGHHCICIEDLKNSLSRVFQFKEAPDEIISFGSKYKNNYNLDDPLLYVQNDMERVYKFVNEQQKTIQVLQRRLDDQEKVLATLQ